MVSAFCNLRNLYVPQDLKDVLLSSRRFAVLAFFKKELDASQINFYIKKWYEVGITKVNWKIPWRREWLPTPVFLPGEFHEQGSLLGYSLLDRRVKPD